MDTTKDIVDVPQNEEENNDDVSTEQPNVNNNNNNNNTSATSSPGLQQIEDDTDGLPLPMGMAEDISNRAEPPQQKGGKVEQLEDDICPEPPAAMLEASLNAVDPEIASKVSETLSNNLASVNEQNSPPTPFDSAEIEFEDAIAKKKAKDDIMNQKPAAVEVLPSSNRDSIYEPSREIIERGEGIDNTNTGRGGTNRRGWDDIEAQQRRAPDIESNETRGIDDVLTDDVDVPTSLNQGLPELEAYLVEDSSDSDEEEVVIYDATPVEPTVPWWKQRRTKILLGVVLVIVSTLAIVLGIELSKDDQVTLVTNVIVNVTDAPSVSLVPSTSSSPTECVNKIISNKQEIDLQKDLQISDPLNPRVAVDGRNMVVVALDGRYSGSSNGYDGPVYITFYLLDNNDEWQRVQTPIRLLDDVTSEDLSGKTMISYSVAISGTTVFLGISSNDGAGAVLVFEQNDFDEWERVDNPFIHTANTTQAKFGHSVGIDGDLACIVNNLSYEANLYHREDNNKWVQFNRTKGIGYECSISEDIIAMSDWSYEQPINPQIYKHTFVINEFESSKYSWQLYKYNRDLNAIFPVQDSVVGANIWAMDLSNDYLVYWDYVKGEAFIYRQDEVTLHQRLNITSTGPSFNSLSLDNDMLVVGGDRNTYIYSLQDGYWVESITLDESFDDIKISGRTIIATKYNDASTSEISSFNIQDCTQGMPTQLPSLSPSTPPSVSSLPTLTARPSTTLNYMTVEYSFDISYPPGEDLTQIKQDIEGNVTESFQYILSDQLIILTKSET